MISKTMFTYINELLLKLQEQILAKLELSLLVNHVKQSINSIDTALALGARGCEFESPTKLMLL